MHNYILEFGVWCYFVAGSFDGDCVFVTLCADNWAELSQAGRSSVPVKCLCRYKISTLFCYCNASFICVVCVCDMCGVCADIYVRKLCTWNDCHGWGHKSCLWYYYENVWIIISWLRLAQSSIVIIPLEWMFQYFFFGVFVLCSAYMWESVSCFSCWPITSR